jgi:hypothetical protein
MVVSAIGSRGWRQVCWSRQRKKELLRKKCGKDCVRYVVRCVGLEKDVGITNRNNIIKTQGIIILSYIESVDGYLGGRFLCGN